jgi:BirA family transcriptional regulator, biotin operon repressor / biotin---[acetyl-CoA-carboxylase] ligase
MTVPVPALTALTRQAEGIWQSSQPVWPGLTVEVLPRIDSTNTELMRRAREGQQDPVLLVAVEQVAGRGRQGKTWVGAPGASLAFSLGLPLAPVDWSGLSLAVGVAVAEVLHPEVHLKWPNDLWWQGRKLGGILVETALVGSNRYAVIGVGINLQTPSWPEGAQSPVRGTSAVLPVGLCDLPAQRMDLDAGQVLAAVVPGLLRALRLFEAEGFAPFVERFAQRDALKGQAVRLSDGREGVADGIGLDGSLVLHTPQGHQAVVSGEVSVRPC